MTIVKDMSPNNADNFEDTYDMVLFYHMHFVFQTYYWYEN